ncbi:MAG: response regulator [Candidatus Omnitrophica bacterium]|nr:response regulator [Candidatus Omnitrophota bacterium]
MCKAKIMIVDDEPIVLRAYKKELEGQDYSITAVSSGQEAIAKAAKEQFDIILTDLIMPGMNGLELCKEIKKNSQATEVVLMSGYHEEMQKSWIEFIRAGGRDFFLRKPLSPGELKDTINTILIEKKKRC